MPAGWVDQYKEKAKDATLFGTRVIDLTTDELLAAVGFLLEDTTRMRVEHARQRNILMSLRKNKA